MSKTLMALCFLVFSLGGNAQSNVAGQANKSNIAIKYDGTRACVTVKGEPMLILGGELSNSAATCVEDIDVVMPRMKAIGLNTVLINVRPTNYNCLPNW